MSYESTIRDRIRELERKLDNTTSMGASDRYQEELTGLYEKLDELESKKSDDKSE